ncbi:hypothetical protein VTO73DRAFT_12311 [Trametes versicolor]
MLSRRIHRSDTLETAIPGDPYWSAGNEWDIDRTGSPSPAFTTPEHENPDPWAHVRSREPSGSDAEVDTGTEGDGSSVHSGDPTPSAGNSKNAHLPPPERPRNHFAHAAQNGRLFRHCSKRPSRVVPPAASLLCTITTTGLAYSLSLLGSFLATLQKMVLTLPSLSRGTARARGGPRSPSYLGQNDYMLAASIGLAPQGRGTLR